MTGVNKAILVGNLGDDPEVRTMNNGGRVVNLRVATGESWKDRDGNRQERTEWHRVVIFNEPLGKVAEDYLRKGSKVYLEGKIQTRKWTDQKGDDRYSTEIVLQQFDSKLVLLDSRQDSERSGGRNDDRGSSRGGGRRDDRQGSFDDDRDGGEDRSGYGTGRRDDDRGRGGGGYNEGTRAGPQSRQASAFEDDLDDDVPF